MLSRQFRALRDDMSDCTYKYGDLIYDQGIPRIHDGSLKFFTCLPGTEGQATGFFDKHNNPLFEGDIVRTKNGSIGYIVWDDGAFALRSPGSEALDYESSSFYETTELITDLNHVKQLVEALDWFLN